jgi:hypothetical protein
VGCRSDWNLKDGTISVRAQSCGGGKNLPGTHPYSQFLGERDPLAVLAETQEKIPAIARALGTEGLKRTYAPGKWTAAQVIAHLADCEMAFGFRVR